MAKPESEPRGVSRRAVVRAAAWTVPVVGLAVATPAAAASGNDNVPIHYNTATISRRLDLNGNQIGIWGVVEIGSDPVNGTWSNVQVLIELPSPAVDGTTPTLTGAGWSLLNVIPEPGGFMYVLSYPASLSAGASTPALTVFFPGAPNPLVAVNATFRTTATGSTDELLVESPPA